MHYYSGITEYKTSKYEYYLGLFKMKDVFDVRDNDTRTISPLSKQLCLCLSFKNSPSIVCGVFYNERKIPIYFYKKPREIAPFYYENVLEITENVLEFLNNTSEYFRSLELTEEIISEFLEMSNDLKLTLTKRV